MGNFAMFAKHRLDECCVSIAYQCIYIYVKHFHMYKILICKHIQMGNKDSAPVLRDEDVAVLCQSSGLSEEVFSPSLDHK